MLGGGAWMLHQLAEQVRTDIARDHEPGKVNEKVETVMNEWDTRFMKEFSQTGRAQFFHVQLNGGVFYHLRE